MLVAKACLARWPSVAARRKAAAHNLPVQLTSFVGREREKAEIRRLLATTRLVTLTGSGGAGKTRLAMEAAREIVDQSPDGVWLVELASLSDPALVPKVVAAAAGLRDESGRPVLDALAAHLHKKRLLLILDNCEHLVDACARLVDALLRSCPLLRILATSREPLGIAGETTLRVPSLSLPEPGEVLVPERLRDYEAPLLFVQRAEAISPHFAITTRTAPVLAEVCRRLDGIPLAIELAAARVKGLTVGQIAARLDDRFRLLIGGDRMALPRQQTLRATMDWSYQLLSESERVLLRRLSVFAGGFSLEAAEAVSVGSVIESPRILDMLLQLVDKSLIVADDRGDEARYRMLETVRRYGRDRLEEAGEAAGTQRRHRDWYLELAEQADARLRGPEQADWLARLALDHDNFRAALEWSRADDGGAEAALRLATALWWFSFVHGHWSEARTLLETTLTRAPEVPRHLVPKAIHAATFFALRQGDLDRATELGEQGLALCRELGDSENSVWLLTWLGLVALRRGQYDAAARLLEQGVALSQELRDDWFQALVLAQLGILARGAGACQRAVALHTQCLSLARGTGDPLMIAYQLRNLGVDSLTNREPAQAADYYVEALRLCRELGGDRWVSEGCIEGLAAVASARGDHRQAARLFGAGEALRVLTGDSRSLVGDHSYDHHLGATRSVLGESEFSAAWAMGEAMTFDEAIEYAVASADASAAKTLPGKPDTTRGGIPGAPPNPLTPREREVAALVADGVSNRAIATRLFITERTAQTHVQHILDKLGFTSRAQIAAWTAQHGLVSPTS
jgi:predicted ATPase/DNA-binding CsgD family transcriptional regulator